MNIRSNLGNFVNRGRSAVAADKARKGEVDRRAAKAMILMALCAAAVLPELAIAGPWDTMGTQVLAIFTGGLTRTIAIIAVIACGVAAIAGKLSWDWAIKIIIGIVLIFGATAIVDYFISASS